MTNRLVLVSAAFSTYVLSASPRDSSLWLRRFDPFDPFQQWDQQGGDGQFRLNNWGKRQILQFNGGNEGPLVFVPTGNAPGNSGFFSWGGGESWGGRALQSFLDSGQNVDASPGGDQPTTAPVHTRGWRHGNQRPLTYATRPIGDVHTARSIRSGAFPTLGLSASQEDTSLWLKPLAETDANQQWVQIGPDEQFLLWNSGTGNILQFTGGNEQPVTLVEPWMSTGNSPYFSWGSTESWGARALQSYLDSGQNVDAMSPTQPDTPMTGPVRTRGWRHGHQRELTYALVGNVISTLPAYTTATSIALLDVWGEGRIVTTDRIVSGFTQAYNLNKQGQRVSNGPNEGQPIPNWVPVAEYENPQFPLPDACVSYLTLMGSPISAGTVREMLRVLNPTNGVVILYDPNPADQATFQANMGNLIRKPDDPINTPFNEITFAPAVVYGFPGVDDKDEL